MNPRFWPSLRTRLALILATCLLGTATATAKASTGTEIDLTELSVEELLRLPITTVSKKKQQWLESAAAVYVLTAEEIRRSGATTLPEALRRVPGLHVARIDASRWAISARGFNGQFANKLLVLIDGRSVYTPLFGGVFWEAQDTLLEDVERIEVIRGPGATLWGANAVNGVINIITKDAAETQGGLLTLGGGDEDKGFGAARYGGRLGDRAHYRVWAKAFERDSSLDIAGRDSTDQSEAARSGLRLDWRSERDHLMLTAEIYGSDAGQDAGVPILTPPFAVRVDQPIDATGGHLLGRFTRSHDLGMESALQFYFDRSAYRSSNIDDRRETIDLDFQQRRVLGERHEVVWGAGYRRAEDRQADTSLASFEPDRVEENLWTAFAQDEIRFGERWRLVLGSKFEHNDYTGLEIQPGVRALYTTGRHTLWGSMARAVRTPSRGENDVRLDLAVFPLPEPPGLPLKLVAFGSRDTVAEDLLAYELGYRVQPKASLFLDLALFLNVYDDLITIEPGSPTVVFEPVPHVVLPLVAGNAQRGETSGLELAAVWEPVAKWRLTAGYTFFDEDLELTAETAPGSLPLAAAGANPQHQAFLRTSLDLPREIDLDLSLEYADRLPGLDIASHLRFDLRAAWRPRPELELSLVGRNLFAPSHAEFSTTQIGVSVGNQVERAVFGQLRWHF